MGRDVADDLPVAVVIFGGLVSATLLDTLLTPVLYWLYGAEPTRRLLEPGSRDAEMQATPAPAEAI